MPLLPSKVIGPLLECGSSVRVERQLSDASAELFITGQAASKGGGAARWSDRGFPLNATVMLTPGKTVQATQKFGAQTSDLGPGISVQTKPLTVGPVAFKSHTFNARERASSL